MKKKLLSVLLVVCMLLTMLPTMASAATDTLPAAVDNVIKLIDDIESTTRVLTVKDGENITLDLNGHKINSSHTAYTIEVQEGGTLTIYDTKGGGEVNNSSNGSTTIRNNYGTLNIGSADNPNYNNFTIARDSTQQTTNSAIKNEEVGTLNIYGGTIKGNQRSIQNFGNLNISGGTFTKNVEAWTWTDPAGNNGAGKTYPSPVNITGGTFQSFVGLRTTTADQGSTDYTKFGTNTAASLSTAALSMAI